MPVAAASLANLQPAWAPGSAPPPGGANRKSVDVDRAIRQLRRCSRQAVDYCIKVLHDENEPTAHRVKVALAIIDKVIPDAGTKEFAGWNTDDIAAISLHVVLRNQDQPKGGPVIDAQSEPSGPTLTINTIPSGSGND